MKKKIQAAAASEEAHHDLFEAMSLIRNAFEAKLFFEDLCTPSELQGMADRWRVISQLKSGKSYRSIYECTGVSVTTIGRVARSLLLGTGGYNIIDKRFKKRRLCKKKE